MYRKDEKQIANRENKIPLTVYESVIQPLDMTTKELPLAAPAIELM